MHKAAVTHTYSMSIVWNRIRKQCAQRTLGTYYKHNAGNTCSYSKRNDILSGRKFMRAYAYNIVYGTKDDYVYYYMTILTSLLMIVWKIFRGRVWPVRLANGTYLPLPARRFWWKFDPKNTLNIILRQMSTLCRSSSSHFGQFGAGLSYISVLFLKHNIILAGQWSSAFNTCTGGGNQQVSKRRRVTI